MPTRAASSAGLSVAVRAPHAAEWAACRALIPEAFHAGSAPLFGRAEALLAFDNVTGAALGCAAFERREHTIAHLRVRVLRNARRRGIGASLLQGVMRLAAESQTTEVHARVNTVAEPGAEAFLESCGFLVKSRTFTVEAEWEPLRSTISRLCKRLSANGTIPSGVRIASIADVPPEPLARLYTTLIVPELNLAPGAAVPLVTDPRFAGSPVLLVNERPAGMLLIEANNGQNVCIVTARAVIPEYRGGSGWANLLLLAEGFERAGKKGSLRMRFEAPRDNPDTMKLISRAKGAVTGEIVWFVRTVPFTGFRSG